MCAHRGAIRIRAHQQARPANGRKGHADDQFRVVVESAAGVGLGPGKIKDEFTEGMVLEPGGCGSQQALFIVQRENLRLPAIVRAGGAGQFQSGKERVADERVAAVMQRVPAPGGNRRDAGQQLVAQRQCNLIRNVQEPPPSSVSRYLSASSAAMQPEPAEVTACR